MHQMPALMKRNAHAIQGATVTSRRIVDLDDVKTWIAEESGVMSERRRNQDALNETLTKGLAEERDRASMLAKDLHAKIETNDRKVDAQLERQRISFETTIASLRKDLESADRELHARIWKISLAVATLTGGSGFLLGGILG